MKIEILHMIEGARAARGVAVIIDVFRAFTVEAWLVHNGAARIIPVGDQNLAYEYRRQHPDAILVGERLGKMLPGFDFGNSPSQLQHVDLTGKTVVHTTSAGTQGIANALYADEILTGSLVNAAAIARYLRRENPEQVSLVCMGLNARAQTQEDNLCAAYIRSLLEGNPISLAPEIEKLKTTSGAKFFDPAQTDFPEADFALSTQADRFDFVLRVASGADGLHEIQRIDV